MLAPARCRGARLDRLRIAFGGAVADLLQAQALERLNLLLAADLEAAHREGMIHPADFQLDEHAYAYVADIDESGVGHFGRTKRGAA